MSSTIFVEMLNTIPTLGCVAYEDDGKKLVQLGVRMPPTLKSDIEDAAAKERRTASAWSRLVLAEKLTSKTRTRAAEPQLDPFSRRLLSTFEGIDRQDRSLVEGLLTLIGLAAESPAGVRLVRELLGLLSTADALAKERSARRRHRRKPPAAAARRKE